MCRKISASVAGGRAEGLECADPGARTPIGASGNCHYFHALLPPRFLNLHHQFCQCQLLWIVQVLNNFLAYALNLTILSVSSVSVSET